MSFVSRLEKFSKDLGGAFAAPAKFIWDVATSPFNNAEEFNGVSNILKNSFGNLGKSVARPVVDVLEDINAVNQTVIREPLGTASLAIWDVRNNGGNFSDSWKKAWDARDEISLGQSVAANLFGDRIDGDSTNEFDIFNKEQREKAFKQSKFGKYTSGSIDFAAQLFGDVTIVGGKVAKAYRLGEKGINLLTTAEKRENAIASIKAAQEGFAKGETQVNNASKIISDFTENNITYAYNHPLVKASDDRDTMAYLLGSSKTTEETSLVLRLALGDTEDALLQFENLRPQLSNTWQRSNGIPDVTAKFAIDPPTNANGTFLRPWEDADVVKQLSAQEQDLLKNDEFYKRFRSLGRDLDNNISTKPVLNRFVGTTRYQGFEDFITKGRAAKFYDRAPGQPMEDFYQPTIYSRAYKRITWAAGERPAGMVNLNSPDSSQDFMAGVTRALKNLATPKVNEFGQRLEGETLGMTGLEARKFIDEYAAAAGPEQRAIVVYRFEHAVTHQIAKEYNITPEKAEQIYMQYNGNRKSALQVFKEYNFGIDEEGTHLTVPFLESQNINALPMMDFDKLYHSIKVNQSILRGPLSFKDGIVDLADVLQDAFKVGTLLRLGYTTRNAIDSQLRIAAAIGPMATLQHLPQALKNVFTNAKQPGPRLIDNLKMWKGGKTVPVLYKELDTATKALGTKLARTRKEYAEKKLAHEKYIADETLPKADKYPQQEELANLEITLRGLEDDYAKNLNTLEKLAGRKNKIKLGQGKISLKSQFGEDYTVADALDSEIIRNEVSSKSTQESLISGLPKHVDTNLEFTGHGAVTPDMPTYFDEWARVLTNQFGNSAVVKVFINSYLKNGNDWAKAEQQTLRWLTVGKGKDLLDRLSPQAFPKEGVATRNLPTLGLFIDEAPAYVTGMANFVKRYIPSTDNNIVLKQIADGQGVTAKQLRESFPDATTLPAIHGRILEENLTRDIAKTYHKQINKFFNVLGALPEDNWARFPLYVTLYRDALKKQIKTIEELTGARLTTNELSGAMKNAHTEALREVNKTLFTVLRRSNVGGLTFIRMISPFFNAQENAYKTWARIIGKNPAVLNRGQLLWTAPNRAGFVTDQNGEPIEGNELTYDGTIWLEVPKPLQKLPGLSTLTNMGIPQRSLDIVFGGGFEVPVGPYVAIPASEIVKRQPTLESSLKWAIPYGPERNAITALLPTWVKRQMVKSQAQNSPEYARMYQLIWTTEQHNARDNGTPYPTPSEIQKKVDAFYNMRTIASLVLPFAPRFDTPYRMYMDKWREYQRDYGTNADDKFLQDYPEFFDFAISLSQNVGGVQASVDTVEAIKANKDLVSSLYQDEPALIGLVVNNPTGYDFSQAAYEWEYAAPITPGSKQTFRGTNDPVDVQKQNEAKRGWIQYRQFMSTQIDPILAQRGLSSIRDARAKDLRVAKDAMVKTLANTNQSWYDDYLDTDGSKTNRVIRGLNKILDDEKFMSANADNPTWRSVAAYMALRNELAKELSKRKVKTLGAKANLQLAKAFDEAVGRLKQDDIGFSDLYDRFLSRDTVYDKYLGTE